MPITINGSTGIAGVDGSASTPAIQGTDTNTGVTFPAADTVAVSTGGTERMRVTSGGNVGIGTSSPGTLLELSGSAAAGGDPSVTLTNTTASTGRKYQIVSGDGGPLRFVDVTASAERARIDSSGNLLVGKTTSGSYTTQGTEIAPSSTSANFAVTSTSGSNYDMCRLTRTGTTGIMIGFYNGSSRVGDISIGASSTSYSTSSDYRLKENVQPMQNALATVAQLNPVTYTWKADGSHGQGFIAHELQAVVPDCVTGEKDAVDDEGKPIYQGIDTSFLVATLTKAIQELKAELDDAKARIAALEAK